MQLVSMVVTGLCAYVAHALGINGEALFFGTLLAWLPVLFVVVRITVTLFPPEVEVEDDYRIVLYGNPQGKEGPTHD
jgi:hypothetical protein